MAKLHEEGDNYRFELEGELAVCRVWSRPDLDFEAGARLAAKKIAVCRALAAGPAHGMLFDLREAPKVTGPKTQSAMAQIISAWEAAARPIAIVVSPASMQKLQLTRISREVAPHHAQVFLDGDAARAWLAQRMSEPAPAPDKHSSRAAARPSSLRAGTARPRRR